MAGANWADFAFDEKGHKNNGKLTLGNVEVSMVKGRLMLNEGSRRLLMKDGELDYDGVHIVVEQMPLVEGIFACVWHGNHEAEKGFIGLSCYGYDSDEGFGVTPSNLAWFWYKALYLAEKHIIPEVFAKIDVTQAAGASDISDSFLSMLGIKNHDQPFISVLVPRHELAVLTKDLPTAFGYDRTKLDLLIKRAKELVPNS